MKRTLILLFLLAACLSKAQILFSDSNGGYTLQTYTTSATVTNYTTLNSSYTVINDGHANNVGSLNGPNKPFHVPGFKGTGWAVLYNAIENDTFLVSTSWMDTAVFVDRWVVTPLISTITASTVLSWEAMSPDPTYKDGYEIYVTTYTGTLNSSNFSVSDKIFTMPDANTVGGGENTTWTKRGVYLGMYAGQNLRIGFRENSKDQYQIWLDDITVQNVSNGSDAAISPAEPPIYKYNTINTNGNINCKITNAGYFDINSITLNYAISGVTNQLQAFSTSAPIRIYGSQDFTFSTPYNISTPGIYKVKVWVSYVNGLVDQNHVNDTISTYITIMNSAPSKTVLAEQFLSAFDGYSPDGQDKLFGVLNPSVVAVNIHDGDSLKVASGTGLISAYRKSTTTACIDRTYFYDVASVPVDRSDYANRIAQRANVIVPASVSIVNKNYNSLTRVLNFTVQADFYGEVKGDYRIDAYITENNVYGPSGVNTYNGWNQLSYMYNIPWSPYYQQGNYYAPANGYVLDAFHYKHYWVLDAALDGSFGSSGGPIPLSGPTQGLSFTKAFSYTVPASPVNSADTFRYNIDNMYIVGFVAEYSINKIYRTVLNCTQDKITSAAELVGVNELSVEDNLFMMYPNPCYGNLNILIPENSFSKPPIIRIIDVLGKEVYVEQTEMNYGSFRLNLNHLSNGTYYIVMSDGNSSSLKKLVITR